MNRAGKMDATNAVRGEESPMGRRTIQKIQIRLLPVLFILYIISYIDRINISFAALTMNKELAITSRQFGFAAGVFFLGYCLFEVPLKSSGTSRRVKATGERDRRIILGFFVERSASALDSRF